MPNPLEIRLPETGIVESVRVKLENAREKLAHFDVDLIVEKEDGECEYPVIDVVESIEDCAIDYPDSITSAFFEVYSETMQKKIPRQTLIYKLRPENRLVDTFIKSLNLAFLISVSALSTEKCLKYFEQYRNLSGYWKKPVFPYDRSGGTFKTLREHKIIYESLQQRMVFAMVYCLCVKHPSNVEGSELKELLQFIYDSSKEIPQLIDRILHHQIPLWYKNPQHTTSHKEETCAQRGRKPKPLFNDEEKEQKAISLLMGRLAQVTAKMKVDVSATNIVNHFIITFALELRKQKEYQGDVNSASIFRFLEKCQEINIAVTKDSYERFLRSYISENAEETLSVSGGVRTGVREILDNLYETE
jgi:hypothetical protein